MEEMRVIRDGTNWVFVLPDFVNIQVSSQVWIDDGDTDIDAIYRQLIDQEEEKKRTDQEEEKKWMDDKQMDGLYWASEIEQDMNACRLFKDKDVAIKTITINMEDIGYKLKNLVPDATGTKGVMMVFVKGNKIARWIICYVEIECGYIL